MKTVTAHSLHQNAMVTVEFNDEELEVLKNQYEEDKEVLPFGVDKSFDAYLEALVSFGY